ncbi:MAG: hypothetical protein HYX53_01025 [Chloroflexi bacterium]|nr:hypothetical protein [Chloroflexota bacterium]
MAVDIVDLIRLEFPCPVCGKRYPIPLAQVLLSQDMMHEGCAARAEEECPPDFFARLLDRGTILTFQQGWQALQDQAAAAGGALLIETPNDSSDEPDFA